MKKVLVLLSTYNGEKYLEQQLLSLINQVEVEINILVRDDGSTDGTKEILTKFSKKGFLEWYSGDNLKPAHSFLNLMKNASVSDYYAFCDQDDIWEDRKLIEAIKKLEKFNLDEPALYFSRTNMVDNNLNELKKVNKVNKVFSFGASLVRNNVTGCTMVFNKSLLNIVNDYTPKYLAMHDQWVYLVCKLFNGNVYYDKRSFIKYRQHDNNYIGGCTSFKDKLLSNSLTSKSNNRWNQAMELLEGYKNIMPNENKNLLYQIKHYKLNLYNRIKLAFNKNMYTFTKYDILFVLSCILGKF